MCRCSSRRARKPPTRWCSSVSRKLSLVYRKLETCGKPWVAALNGTAMGGCFELALACHHRIAADNPKTRLGLPEIKVGLFPGAGGTQRIARMMATADALQFLLKGDQIRLDRAKTMKLVDNVVPAADLVQRREGLDQDLAEVEAAVGRGRLQAARRPDLVEDGHDDLAGRERALPQGDAGQLPGRARDPVVRVRGPAGAVRHGAAHRVALFRQDHALARGGGDDPLAVRLDAGAEQGRAPPGQSARDQPEEGRRARRGPDGRGHRLCDGAGRHRRGADRPRPGSGRQGQGLFGEHHGGPDQARPRQAGRRRRAARAHHADAGLRRSSRASTWSSRRCSRTAR